MRARSTSHLSGICLCWEDPPRPGVKDGHKDATSEVGVLCGDCAGQEFCPVLWPVFEELVSVSLPYFQLFCVCIVSLRSIIPVPKSANSLSPVSNLLQFCFSLGLIPSGFFKNIRRVFSLVGSGAYLQPSDHGSYCWLFSAWVNS